MNQLSDPWCHSQMEILPSLVNVDDIQKASNVGYISVDVAICFRELLYAHLHYLSPAGAYSGLFLKKETRDSHS